VTSWSERQDGLLRLARRQLFFVGGAPRSGTTWLQRMMDAHPDVCRRGEGLFGKYLSEPIASVYANWSKALASKNELLFADTGGFRRPTEEDTDMLLATAILLGLQRQLDGLDYVAIGEKTPENVFFFPHLKRLFPAAKFIGIARDPRDVLSSAWHFFYKPVPHEGERTAKLAFIRNALPSLVNGTRSMLALRDTYPADCTIVTYEQMHAESEAVAGKLFRSLGVADEAAVIAGCVARTSFAAISGGRRRGNLQEGAFLRKGLIGDWVSTFDEEMNDLILQEMAWSFPCFDWSV
jgi:Sulfotransferase family